MIFGPVLPIELLTSSRRRRYFVVRLAYAAALFITVWMQYESSLQWQTYGTPVSPTALASIANEFFGSFCLVQLTAVLLITPALIAGTIAEEKERRTIEYLLVTDLRNREIVIGKLLARLMQLIMVLAVGWPMLAILRLLGGVAMEQILASTVITASTALAVASLSIWCSVQARRGRDAVMRVYVIGLAMLIVPPILDIFPGTGSDIWFVVQPIVEQCMAANPYVAFENTFQTWGVDWDSVWILVRNQAVLSAPPLLFATLLVRRVHLRQAAGNPSRRFRGGWRLWRPRLGELPILWKELFAERWVFSLGVVGTFAQALLFLGVLVPGGYLFFTSLTQTAPLFIDEFQIFVIGVGTTVACVGLLTTAVRAATSVTSERERQTWDILISTPLEPLELILGKVLGSLYAMRSLMALLMTLVFLGLVAGKVSILLVPILVGELIILGLFASMVGVVYSLWLKSSVRSMAATVGTTVFLGGGYLFCCTPMFIGGESEFLFAGCVPFLLGMTLSMRPGHITWDAEEARLLVTCFVGTGLYLVATVFLGGMARAQFDRITGRPKRLLSRRSPQE